MQSIVNYKNVVTAFVLLLSITTGYAQETGINCVTAIKDAEEMYKDGNYDNAIQLINSTFKECSLSKREKEDAYLILAQAYLEKENYTAANNIFVKVLNNDPNFKLKENLY